MRELAVGSGVQEMSGQKTPEYLIEEREVGGCQKVEKA